MQDKEKARTLSQERIKREIMAEFRAAVESPRRRALEAQTPVAGYLCSYLPPELLLAAGLYPLRLRGIIGRDSASGDAYLSHLTCSFIRCVTAAVLDGGYDFLAGQISLNTCDHVRRGNDVLIAKSDLSYHGFLSVPRSFREDLFPWYLEELTRLKSSLEERFKVSVTDQALREAITRMNPVRERLQRLEALRRAEPPLLTGTEALTAAVAARSLRPEPFLELADALISAAESGEPVSGLRARVILIGGELDDPRFLAVIEGQGAHVAGDLLCFGSRGLGRAVVAGPDPLSDLARAYLYQVPCARMMGEFPRRYEEMLKLYAESKAEGIIFQRIKFCQIWSTEVHNLRHRFESAPLPFLVLEREYGTVPTGQVKTRVQAFLEQIESGRRTA